MTISVIIPIYNVSAYIERCLHSLMNQTYSNIECILVDDCGTDDSVTKCEQMVAEYDGPIRFRIIHHEQNRGLSAARNTGTNEAIGKYLFYLDSDDEILTDCLEHLLTVANNHPGIEMVIGNFRRCYINTNKTIIVKSKFLGNTKTNEEVRNRYYNHQILGHAWNKLILRDFIIQRHLYFREDVLYEDILWLFYVMKHLSRVGICDIITYNYNIRPESITTSTEQYNKAIQLLTVFYDILRNLTKGKEQEELNYFGDLICQHYVKFRHIVKEYDELFHLYWHLSRQYSCTPWVKSSVAYIFGHNPYGWSVLHNLRYYLANNNLLNI